MKLISMTDFVLEQHGFSDIEVRLNTPFVNERFRERISNYANFLKQPLKLEMFVSNNINEILFEGFEFTDSQKYSVNNNIKLSVSPYGLNNERLLLTKLNEENKFHTWFQLFTIEDLIQCEINLTQNAIKRIFG
jgi:hypothetical protein